MGVLLSNTLKRIRTNFPIKPPKKFLLFILRILKHTFCTILTPRRLRFLATFPSMGLLSNTLKRIRTNFPIKPPKKFLLVILRILKHTFCTILTPRRLCFLATFPSMGLLLTLLMSSQVGTSKPL